ncbi:DGQHR domain-containing protein [bacterium]|nr:DGQHR domain-containing protein [bacterium]MBU1990139.1 DGQHR domain-containing protein [bacterium]
MGIIEQIEDSKYKYVSNNGILLNQRDSCNFKIFTFKEKVSNVMKFTNVTRQADQSKTGYQRIINPNRVKAIVRYLDANPNNIIPNNIVIALTKDEMTSKIDSDQLAFEFDIENNNKQALIIDGQHRLHAINTFDPDEEVLITALVNIDVLEQAIQFITINTKSQSAAKTDVKSVLNADYYQNILTDRLSNAGITNLKTSTVLDYFHKSIHSPFKGYLDWQLTESPNDRIIQLNALEQIVKLCKNEIEEFNEDEDTIIFFLSVLWKELKKKYSACWELSISTQNKESNLLKKSTIIGVTEYFIQEAISANEYSEFFDFNDITEESIKKLLERNLFHLINDFWNANWEKGLDTSAGRAMLKSSIRKTIDNIKKGKDWSEKVDLIQK